MIRYIYFLTNYPHCICPYLFRVSLKGKRKWMLYPPSLFMQSNFKDKMQSCGLPDVHKVYVWHSWFLLDKLWISPLEPPLGSYWLILQLPIFIWPMTHSSREVLATAGEVLIENTWRLTAVLPLKSIHTHPDKHFCDRNTHTTHTHTHTHTHISEMLKVILKYELACLCHLYFLQVRWWSGKISGHGSCEGGRNWKCCVTFSTKNSFSGLSCKRICQFCEMVTWLKKPICSFSLPQRTIRDSHPHTLPHMCAVCHEYGHQAAEESEEAGHPPRHLLYGQHFSFCLLPLHRLHPRTDLADRAIGPDCADLRALPFRQSEPRTPNRLIRHERIRWCWYL